MSKKPIYDYGQVLERFHKNLKSLRDHLYEHDLYVGVEGDVAEIDRALVLLRRIIDCEYDWDEELTVYDRKQADWRAFWHIIEGNMQWWWD